LAPKAPIPQPPGFQRRNPREKKRKEKFSTPEVSLGAKGANSSTPGVSRESVHKVSEDLTSGVSGEFSLDPS